jgi:hypothetical protein
VVERDNNVEAKISAPPPQFSGRSFDGPLGRNIISGYLAAKAAG